MVKKIVSLLLVTLIILSVFQGCSNKVDGEAGYVDVTTPVSKDEDIVNSFSELSDPALLDYLESQIYSDLIDNIDSEEYFVENIELAYLSNEYIQEISYNSKENVYFGFTLSDLEEQFQGEKYVFTLNEDGKTIAKAFEPYDDTFDKIITNVATGTGVILVCVVVSAVTGVAGAPAACAIFAASAKTGTVAALSSGVFSGVSAGIITGIETGDFNESLKSAALAGSEEFKWGAITGAIGGSVGKTVSLRGATVSGLSMNQVATIQKESKYPLDVIKEFRTMEQYKICKNAGITAKMVNGKTMLIRDIDLDYVDEFGLTNLERMKLGKAPLDPTGVSYELHHIGQEADSTLAILTRAEHRQGDNHKIWHIFGEKTKVHGEGNDWNAERKDMWKALAEYMVE